eukprot:m.184115 g.184115  ORF g.184115 m.184115 type:complete len:507 (+) comp16663_c0_seq3:114-1634(+)
MCLALGLGLLAATAAVAMTLLPMLMVLTATMAVATFFLLRHVIQLKRSRSPVHRACLQDIDEKRSSYKLDGRALKTIGFFHPYCNAGGGGERVLWSAVNGVCRDYPHFHCVVYTGDVDVNGDAILAKAKQRFGVDVDRNRVTFVFLGSREYVEAKHYPRFTMLLQSLGSLVLGMEALLAFLPDVFIDTMGYAFVLPLFAYLGSVPVAAYVHYPTISTDMLEKVQQRRHDFNNDSNVTSSTALSTVKLVYYRLFAWAYGLVGGSASVVMANSTWTANHIKALWWGARSRCKITYPPCDVSKLATLALEDREELIVSVAQFRPEKNHKLQLHALRTYIDDYVSAGSRDVQLIMVGGCRNQEDERRVQDLRDLARELQLEEGRHFRICVNVSYQELQEWLSKAMIGLHTMADEHFGIGVVEFMAAGAIALAHNSAGPQGDIVVPHDGEPTGFLATTAQEYAKCIDDILTMSPKDRQAMQERARRSVNERFSEAEFQRSFLANMQPLLSP